MSRDNYSTSQHPSMISQPHQKAAAPAKGAPNRVRKYYNKNKKPGADSVLSGEVTSPTGIIDPKKKESMEQPKLKNIITQNVARLEKQNPSTKASILSHSLQEDDDRADINARASGLENVTEEEGYHEKSPINKDGSSYNVTPNDIAAIPSKEQSPRTSKHLSPKARSSRKQVQSRN